MLNILHRDYGPNVRVVGLADGTGCAEDPEGLPMEELLRLFREALPLAEINPHLLGPKGKLTLADTPEGIATRNTMHNRVLADAFVPAGGRPATMNVSNWRDFLLPDGTPSARIIVEGANLFLTPEARLKLFETAGLPIVKDSSANKCGVICSSMEIRASMCVSDDEFVALKREYVDEVLVKLREMAQLEAQLLFAEARRDASTPLPAISERISFAILRVADAVITLMDAAYAKQTPLWPNVSAQLPASLAASEHAPRLPERLPYEYQRSTVAKSLASRLVYREGLAFVEGLPDAQLPLFALSYLEEEQRVKALAKEIATSGHTFASEAEALLLKGGVRVAAAQRAAERRVEGQPAA
jgi:glutamate dehydrogenase